VVGREVWATVEGSAAVPIGKALAGPPAGAAARPLTLRFSDQRGEDRAVGPVQAWSGMGAAQHGNLVPQHEQFEVLGRR
jgi:hypothetical protein